MIGRARIPSVPVRVLVRVTVLVLVRAPVLVIVLALLSVLAAPPPVWAQDGGARDGGVPDAAGDASTADTQVADAAPPMLPVGPAVLQAEVVATAPAPGRAVATVQRATLVTAGELAGEINRRVPALRAAYVDPTRVDELARSIVRDRVFAEAARRAGLMDDEEVKRELERTLARILLERALAADPGPAIDDAAARAFYDVNIADYTRLEQVRALAIVLPTREEAVRVLAEVSRVSERRFESVARRRSTDPQTRRRDGNLGWLFVGSRPEEALIQAAFALRVGETAQFPLEIDGRFYVLRAAERRPPEPVPFERARSAIVSRMRAEYRQRAIDVLLARAALEQGVRVRSAAALVRVGP